MSLRLEAGRPPAVASLQPGTRSALAAPLPIGAAATPVATSSLLERLPWKVRLAIFFPVFAVVAATFGTVALMVYYTFALPDPRAMQLRQRAQTHLDGAALAQRGAAEADVPLDRLPAHVAQVVIAAEDRRFFTHWGVDPTGFVRATLANLRAGQFVLGNATLTQQLAATLAVSAGPGWARNLEDVTLALWLEARLTKHEILELYLNSADFGGGASGIEAAAQRTFGKSARELTLAEAAVIAGFLGAPTEQTPIMSAEAARARGRLVLAKMLEAGLISAEAERRAAGESIAFATPRRGEDAIELLLGRMPSPAGAGHAAMAATAAEESTQALPSASRSTSASKSPAYPIDADVIARALAEESAAKSAATAPREPTAARPEAEAWNPGGLMSLGRTPR